MMDCSAFKEWLDAQDLRDGGGESTRSEGPLRQDVMEHARTCARCAFHLEAALALESALGATPAAAPAAFTDSVLVRIAREAPAAQAHFGLPAEFDLPIWVRVLADPAVVMASVICGVSVGLYLQLSSISDRGWALLNPLRSVIESLANLEWTRTDPVLLSCLSIAGGAALVGALFVYRVLAGARPSLR